MQPDDIRAADNDPVRDANERLTAAGLFYDRVAALNAVDRPDGTEYVAVVMRPERRVEFEARIREVLAGIDFEIEDVDPRKGGGVFYGARASGTGWLARRRDRKRRHEIVRRMADGA
jgi:hypothetical protein